MKATILTASEIRNSSGREYNPCEWDNMVDRMTSRYSDVIFYHVPKGDGYEYDRYFAEYTLPEGLRLFGSFSYSGSITNGGFFRLDKVPTTTDNLTLTDALQMINDGKKDEAMALVEKLNASTLVNLSYGRFHDQSTDEMVMIGTSKEARAWMTERSVKYGMAFTKG